jgi:hypothetical protein
MNILQTCDNLRVMTRKKSGEGEISIQDSIRFGDAQERKRLNEVLRDLRDKADGDIDKTRFFKALMGLEGYSLKKLTQKHRDYLSGRVESLSDEIERPVRSRKK